MNKNVKPFVKWVGGKRQFLNYIDELIPENFNNYHEPFLGGGAVFFHLLAHNKIKNSAYINDFNVRLIKTYKVVKNNPRGLMKALDEYYNKSNKDFYLNQRIKIESYRTNLEIASWFIYVNKAGFNGLYRVNSTGGFNVPYGKNDNKKLYDEDNIIETSKAMKNIDLNINSNSYEKAFKNIKKGDFVFIDPPYDYEVENKSGFTRYTNPDFKREMQENLAKLIKEIDKKGAYFLKTNHDTQLIRDLYKDFNITRRDAYRFINSNPRARKNATKEVFIKNY